MTNISFPMIGWALCLVLLGTFAQAKDEGDATRWLTAKQEQALIDSVPAPPAPNSTLDEADKAEIMHIQETRTEDMENKCVRDKTFSYFLFQSVYGKNILPEGYPKFYEMLKNVTAATRVIDDAAKNKYKKLRPYQEHPGVVRALFTVNGYSYPSGHSMGSYALATVLSAIFPDKKQAFFDRAAQIAQSRVNAGVHYPSDIKQGGILGRATGDAIVATSSFQSDLAAVQAELKK